ncbi:MAG: ArnT family glycosyltransferase [Candidatus Acidiferrales bacterium]
MSTHPGASVNAIKSERFRRSNVILFRVAFIVLLAYCTIGAALLLFDSVSMIPTQSDITYPEGAEAYLAILGARTGKLDHSVSAPPYVIQAYGPLFYVMNVAVARASKLDIDATLRNSRALTFGCFLLCGFMVFRISRTLQFSAVESGLAGAMLLAQPAFLMWDTTMRSDVPALLGMLLCVYFAVGEDRLGQKRFVFSGIAAGVAFLVKQSAATAPAAVAVALLSNRKNKPVLVLVASAALPVAIMLAFLLWHREAFLGHFFALTTGTWSLGAAARWMLTRRAISMLPVPLIIGGTGFFAAMQAGQRPRIIAWFALMSLVAGLATIPQVGGDVNYFLPVLAGSSLLLPFAMQTVKRTLSGSLPIAMLAVAVPLAGAVVDVGVWQRYRPNLGRTHLPYGLLSPLSVLSDKPYVAMHAHNPGMLDPFTSHDFELKGRSDPAPVIAMIERGQYDLVILSSGRVIRSYRGISYFGTPIVNALNEDYQVFCETPNALILKPRSREIPISAAAVSTIFGRCATANRGAAPDLSLAKAAR